MALKARKGGGWEQFLDPHPHPRLISMISMEVGNCGKRPQVPCLRLQVGGFSGPGDDRNVMQLPGKQEDPGSRRKTCTSSLRAFTGSGHLSQAFCEHGNVQRVCLSQNIARVCLMLLPPDVLSQVFTHKCSCLLRTCRNTAFLLQTCLSRTTRPLQSCDTDSPKAGTTTHHHTSAKTQRVATTPSKIGLFGSRQNKHFTSKNGAVSTAVGLLSPNSSNLPRDLKPKLGFRVVPLAIPNRHHHRSLAIMVAISKGTSELGLEDGTCPCPPPPPPFPPLPLLFQRLPGRLGRATRQHRRGRRRPAGPYPGMVRQAV